MVERVQFNKSNADKDKLGVLSKIRKWFIFKETQRLLGGFGESRGFRGEAENPGNVAGECDADR